MVNLILLAIVSNSLVKHSECQVQLRRLQLVAAVVDVWSPTQHGSLALGLLFASCLEQQHCNCVHFCMAYKLFRTGSHGKVKGDRPLV